MSEQEQHSIQAFVSPELEYCYRDIANIFIGNGEVTFEFGIQHKANPTQATISNRIVMTTNSALAFYKHLEEALIAAQNGA